MGEDDKLRDPGDYALMWANGVPWAVIVKLIRNEAIRNPKQCYPCDELNTLGFCDCA